MSVKTTKKRGTVDLVMRVNFCMTVATTKQAGNWTEIGLPVRRIADVVCSMQHFMMTIRLETKETSTRHIWMMTVFRSPALFVEMTSGLLSWLFVDTTFVRIAHFRGWRKKELAPYAGSKCVALSMQHLNWSPNSNWKGNQNLGEYNFIHSNSNRPSLFIGFSPSPYVPAFSLFSSRLSDA